MNLQELRKAKGIKIKEIPLNFRTVAAIESGKDSVTLKHYKTYLQALGLRLIVLDKDLTDSML